MTFIDNKGFIIGGLSKAPTDQVTVYDTKAEDFKDFKLTGQPPGERSHHTTIAIKKCLYIFGGESISGQNIVLRPVSNELWKLDTSNFSYKKKDAMEWSMCIGSRGIYVPGKKGHAMTNYSKYIIVHGGMGDD
jgi:hypothetical protein